LEDDAGKGKKKSFDDAILLSHWIYLHRLIPEINLTLADITTIFLTPQHRSLEVQSQ
jgi:hypothetical protein